MRQRLWVSGLGGGLWLWEIVVMKSCVDYMLPLSLCTRPSLQICNRFQYTKCWVDFVSLSTTSLVVGFRQQYESASHQQLVRSLT